MHVPHCGLTYYLIYETSSEAVKYGMVSMPWEQALQH